MIDETDTNGGYVPPEIVEGGGDIPPPRDANDQYICDWPGCDRTFPKYMGVVMHKRRVHVPASRQWSTAENLLRTPSGYPVRERCTLCGKPITAARMNSHLKRVHNATIKKANVNKRDALAAAREVMYPNSNPPTSRTTLPQPVTTGPTVPMAPEDENWEKMASVRRATAEYVRLTAERADFKLNLDQFVVDDEVVILKSSDGSRWMLRRID